MELNQDIGLNRYPLVTHVKSIDIIFVSSLSECQMLRSLSKLDLPQVLNIEILTQIAPWSAETFERCLEAGFRGWVIEQNERILGFIIVSFQSGESHILNLCVHPDYQCKGHGQQLIEEALFRAKAQKMSTAFLEVRRSNYKAIALYEKMGFVQIGERKQYYPALNGREDALMFAKDLGVDEH